MKETIYQFTQLPLVDAVSGLLSKLGIKYKPLVKDVPFDEYFEQKDYNYHYVTEARPSLEHIWNIGYVTDESLQGKDSSAEVKYKTMSIFACEVKPDANFKRQYAVALTRAFNRLSSKSVNYKFDLPVIVLFRQGNLLSIATCDRLDRKDGAGDKVGKVTILRNINCVDTHRGHIEILKELGGKTFSTFEDLHNHWKEVFSSELLTKKFYRELSDWYAWAIQIVRFPNDLDDDSDDTKYNTESTIRLVTRLIFVWFLKQKHLIPEEFFDVKFIQNKLVDNFDPYNANDNLFGKSYEGRYYKAILQNLFFAMLNSPINNSQGSVDPDARRFSKQNSNDHGNNKLLRYHDYFIDADLFVKLANEKVPFLNGGLFDCLDDKDKKLYYDGFSDNPKVRKALCVPDFLFFGEEVGKAIDLSEFYGDKNKKKVSARGIIDILNSYIFTVEENTPLDQEVSLDPELLGKVFENLLAAYNPETKQSARKQTGSFYTPREIVQYMVDESLVAHLKRMCGEEMEGLYRSLISYQSEEISLSDIQKKSILNALYHCKILDPACGSGAFPMGILQQMVHILSRIDPDNNEWKALMVEKALSESKDALETDTEVERHQKILDIEYSFNQARNNPDYARKLYLIENCIYGVDIQPIAIQISHLRFFISLIVDQKENNNPMDNFGIRPLPNLEANFVAANTLVPLDKMDDDVLSNAPVVKEIEKLLRAANHKIFAARTPKTKRKWKLESERLRKEMEDKLIELGIITNNSQISTWNMFDQNSSACFFDPEWMFGVKGGFDIVIGNPPYLRIQGIRASDPVFADKLTTLYKSATGSFDLYACFTEKALSVIHKDGIVNFIMPQKWTNASFGKGLRELVSKNHSAYRIIDFGAFQVFNASTYTALQWFKSNSNTLQYIGLDRDLFTNAELSQYLDSLTNNDFCSIPCEKLSKDTWVLSAGDTNKLLSKLEKQPRRVADVFDKIFQGLATSRDDTYFLQNCVLDNGIISGYSKDLGKRIEIEQGLVKPLLKGDDVHRYENISTNKVVVFPYKINGSNAELYTDKELMSEFPMGYEYLKQCESILRSREHGRLFNDEKWYRYIYPKNLVIQKQEKLVAPDISMGGNFAYDESGKFYQTTTIYGFIKKDKVEVSYTLLMAILNSNLCWWFMKNTGTVMSGGFYRYKPAYINPFPLPSDDAILSVQKPMEILVEQILSLKKQNPQADTSALEHEIDLLVYDLYGLTKEERLFIDPEYKE